MDYSDIILKIVKTANDNALAALSAYTDPKYKPISQAIAIISDAYNNDDITPQCLRPKLKEALFGLNNDDLNELNQLGINCFRPQVPPAALTNIKETLARALNVVNNESLRDQYIQFLQLISQLRSILFAPLGQAASPVNVEPASPVEEEVEQFSDIELEDPGEFNKLSSVCHFAAPAFRTFNFDPTQLNAILSSLKQSMNVATQIDEIVQNLSRNILSSQASGTQGLDVPGEDELEKDQLGISEIPEEKDESGKAADWSFAGGQVKKFYDMFDKFKMPDSYYSRMLYGLVKDILPKLSEEQRRKIISDFDIAVDGGSFPVQPFNIQEEDPDKLYTKTYKALSNLRSLKSLFSRSYIVQPYQQDTSRFGEMTKYEKNRFHEIINATKSFMAEKGISEEDFLSKVAFDPDYLSKIVSHQINYERWNRSLLYKRNREMPESQIIGGDPDRPAGSLFEDSASQKSIEMEKYKLSDDQREFIELLASVGVVDPDDLTPLNEWFYEKVINGSIVPDIVESPQSFSEQLSELTKAPVGQNVQQMLLINRAAINYSYAQYLSMDNEFDRVTAKDDEVNFEEKVSKIKVLTKQCFPEPLVEKARSLMKLYDPENYQMLTSGKQITAPRHAFSPSTLVNENFPVSTSYTLFLPFLPYEQMIDEISKNTVRRYGKHAVGGRASVGLFLAMAYGGGYKRSSASKSDIYPNVLKSNPSFFNQPYRLAPLGYVNAPFFEKGKKQKEINAQITERINKRVNRATMSLIAQNPEHKKLAVLYLSRRNASSQLLGPEESIKAWIAEYKKLSQEFEAAENSPDVSAAMENLFIKLSNVWFYNFSDEDFAQGSSVYYY